MPDVLEEYSSVIQKQLELGIVQPIPDRDVGEVGRVHYLPHHAVVKQAKETIKVRVVYDASAKSISQRVSVYWTQLQPDDLEHTPEVSLLPSCPHCRH